MADYPALDLRFRQVAGAAPLEELLHAALDEFQPLAIQEHETADGWTVFFRDAGPRDAAARALSPFVLRSEIAVTPLDVPDEDWARRSQAGLTAIRVGRLVVAPPWDVAPPRAARAPSPPDGDDVTVVIDPSMGFGTGHHETTRLCLALLQGLELTGRRVLDVGTGSGVLAIAAWRLGAADVTALDYDADALQNARENVDRNGGAGAIAIVCGDLSAFEAPPAGVVTANLTAPVLVQHAGTQRRLVEPGGALVVSGFSPADLAGVTAAFAPRRVEEVTEDEWAAALLRW